MNSLVFLAAFLAISNASVVPWGGVVIRGPVEGPSAILQGPGAAATILGPDGGLIKSRIDGGVVLANRGGLGWGGSELVGSVPLLSKGSTVVVAGPAAPGGAIIAGPSGTIATGNGVGKTVIASAPILTRVVSVPQIKVISSDLGLGLGGIGLNGIGLSGLGLNGIGLNGVGLGLGGLGGGIIDNGHGDIW